MKSLLIKNGTLVSSKGSQKADVLIRDGKVARVGESLTDAADEVLNASGLHVLPGVLDPQVHFREPGMTWKEDLRTGSLAAAAGGVTSFFDMPNNNPAITTRALMADKKASAASQCVVNYNFFIGATPDNLEELNAVQNVCGIKIFMGSSTGTLLVEREADLERIFAGGSRLIAVHAEDNGIIEENKKRFPNPGFGDHDKIRDEKAALKATKLAVSLALKHKRRLHILHLTTQEEVEFLAAYKNNPLISCEVCPQHFLLFAPEIYERLGALAQMNPPLRERRHGAALWKGLKEGVIKCMATDHAPHTLEEKAQPYGKAPSGMPGVQTLLPLMLNQAAQGLCAIEDVVRWTSENTLACFGVANKGRFEPGYDADFALVDLQARREVKRDAMLTKCGWSPYEGMTLQGWPLFTIAGGHVVYREGVVDESVKGREIQITPAWEKTPQGASA